MQGVDCGTNTSVFELPAENLLPFLCYHALCSTGGNQARLAGAGSWFRCGSRTEPGWKGASPSSKALAGHPQPWWCVTSCPGWVCSISCVRSSSAHSRARITSHPASPARSSPGEQLCRSPAPDSLLCPPSAVRHPGNLWFFPFKTFPWHELGTSAGEWAPSPALFSGVLQGIGSAKPVGGWWGSLLSPGSAGGSWLPQGPVVLPVPCSALAHPPPQSLPSSHPLFPAVLLLLSPVPAAVLQHWLF